jgi:hypothetical protein
MSIAQGEWGDVEADKILAGSVPDNYDRHMEPMIFTLDRLRHPPHIGEEIKTHSPQATAA